MLNLQKNEVISSSSDHTSDSDIDVPLASLDHKADHKIGSVIGFGRIIRVLRKFGDDDELTKLDRRLLKGFYVANKQELVVDSDD
jgi:hypothetical protein